MILTTKPITRNILFLRKCTKTHLQQCRIPKVFRGSYPRTPASGLGEGLSRAVKIKRWQPYFTGTFVPAHADLKPAIAYKLAQQEWNNSSNSIVKYCSLSSLWLHKQRLLKSDVLAVQYLRRERVRTSAGGVKNGQFFADVL